MRSTLLRATVRTMLLATAGILLTASASLADDVQVYLQAQSFDKQMPDAVTVPMWGFATCTDATFTSCDLPTVTDAPGPQINVATTSAGAGQILIDNGTSTIDVATNLEWLDLTETLGLSYNQVEASAFVTSDGYRHATKAEVETLFVNAGFPPPPPNTVTNSPTHDAAANLLLARLGCTQFCATINATGRGFADDTTPGFTTRPNYHNSGLGSGAVYSSTVSSNLDLVDATSGHFLVRTVTVPVTASLTIHLHNTLPDPVSIVIPGQAGGGDPIMVVDGQGRDRVQSFTHETLPGQTGVYTWSDLRPGTYLYQSGTHPSIQVPMGLYGAVVVGPVTGVLCTSPQVAAYYDTGSCHDAEAVLLFSEIDPFLNERVADAAAALLPLTTECVTLLDWVQNTTMGYPCTVDYTPAYFLVNGELAADLPAGDNTGNSVLLRMLNAGLRSHSPTILGLDMGLLAEDGNRYPGVIRQQSSALLPAGKSLDVLVDMPAQDVTFALFDRMPAFVTGTDPTDQTQVKLTVGAGSPPPTPAMNLAVDDVYPVTEDMSLNIAAPGVLANDDPSLSGVVVVNGPSNGTLLIGGDGAFAYTPNTDFSGSDAFTYSANDGVDDYAAAVTLNVSFANDAPVAADDGPYVNNVGPDISVDAAHGVLGNDADPDGDALTAVLDTGTGVTLNPDGSFTYVGGTPGATEMFTYHASDGTTSSASVTVTVKFNAVANITLDVQDPLGAPVTDYRWLVQEDATFHNNDGSAAPTEMQSLNFHKSYMPVVAQGCVGPGCGGPETSFDLAALDPAKHYYVSVLPNDAGTGVGHTIGGAQIPAPVSPATTFTSPVTVMVNNQPIPTAQLSVIVFEDNAPTNGVPEPGEPGLGGFQITLEDAGGRYGISGGTMSQDAYGEPLRNSLPCAPPAVAGVIVSCPDGTALIKDLPPGKYGVFAVAPSDTGTWTQTSTIEGTKIVDAWLQAGEPPFFVEAGAPGFHVFLGFVNTENLVNPGGPNMVSGNITLLHDPRPPGAPATIDSGSYVGLSHTRPWVGLNTISGDGPNIATVQADENGHFELSGIPDGAYQLVVWDTYLDQVMAFQVVNLPADAGDIGNIPVNAWFSRTEHNVFLDVNENGILDPGEAPLPEQAVNLRWRDGTVNQSYPTDTEGFVPFDQVFPFFSWQVFEIDFTRFKPTGVTMTVDAGGDVTTTDPYAYLLNPQYRDGSPTTRTELGPVLTEGFQGFPGQTSIFDWGKAPYARGENGGIAGIVFYASTRGENDPRLTVGDPWEPGIPGVKVRLYREVQTDLSGGTSLALVEEVVTDSWDASPPDGCPGEIAPGMGDPFVDETLGAANNTRCYDGWRNWNQIRPGVFDGGYAFTGIAPGKYVVEVVPPPGYELVKEEDKNVDFGDAYATAPVSMMMGGMLLTILPDQAMVLAVQTAKPGLTQPPCVGGMHTVSAELSLFPGVETYAPFANADRPLCDRKEVILSDQGQSAADFFLFTSTPVAAQFTGLITDDIANETNPGVPGFGEKWTPAYLPFSIRDFNGQEVFRGYSDAFGGFNGVLPSTFSANIPIPSGYSPAMMSACLNDPGPIPGPSGDIVDPLYNEAYGVFCYTAQFMPGTTTYLDTPILPTSAFAAGYNPVDCASPDGTPVVAQVDGTGAGPLVAPGGTLTLYSQGDTDVPNPGYEGPLATSPYDQPTVSRDFGFGGTAGSVTLAGVPLGISTWDNDVITAVLPVVPPLPNTGELVVTRANGNHSLNTVTVTVGTETPIRVSPGGSIQAAIDGAIDGDLILVETGTYEELVVMHKPVRLQGSGSATVINASKRPPIKVQDWITKVEDLYTAGDFDLLPGQPTGAELVGPALLGTEIGPGITVLAKNDGSFTSNPSRIDGFTITGADSGGGIFVNGYAHGLEISNNQVTGNSGNLNGGIRIGHPFLPDLTGGPFGFNTNVNIHHNAVTRNGSLGEQSTGGGVSLCTGSDDYVVSDNFVCGNYTQGDGAGIGHLGLSDGGTIAFNQVLFNQSINQELAQHGGGITIAGEPTAPPGLSLGAGNVTVDANLIDGNQAGTGHGGGVRTQLVNGTDATTSPWSLTFSNNVIVNNVAAWSGAGMSLQDTTNATIVNNTIANNDSTANLGSLIVANLSEPQPAGISSERHSPGLAAALSQPDGFSDPTLSNNIVWHNRAFYYDGMQVPPLRPDLAAASVGECAAGASYWDLGVLGEPLASPALQLDPTDSILSDPTGYDPSNLSGDPDFVSEYCNGVRSLQTPWGPMTATAAFGEGGNFLDVRYGPLTRSAPGGSPWDYHIGAVSAGLDNANATGAPDHDIDGQMRPSTDVDRGADEVVFVPEPGMLLGQFAGVAALALLARRRRGRGRA